MERSGGLLLCVCEHPLAYHPEQPAWFFHEGSSEAAKAAPMVKQCAFCDCKEPVQGEFQGFRVVMSEDSLKG